MIKSELTVSNWPAWQKIAFRFCCIYFLLNIAPWSWFDKDIIPGAGYVTQFFDSITGWIVGQFNKYWFHFEKTSIVNNGSGDTSDSYEHIFTYLSLAFSGSLIWSLLDRKRKNYTLANYWLNTFLRYFLVICCCIYGFDKLYALQMPFPTQSQLATPLGDFLPMRLSWMFIGYSTPYEMFLGIAELLVGFLLLYRRTITLGLFVGAAVFINVMVLNLCYDIPVKLFSIHLSIYFLYLLINDCKRLIDFFIFNKAVPSNKIHDLHLPKKWMRIPRIILKVVFVVLFVILPFFNTKDYYRSFTKEQNIKPIQAGIYDVAVYEINKDTLPALVTDTIRWKDIIFEKNATGSVGSVDKGFRQRYRRGYFAFFPDSAAQTIVFRKTAGSQDSIVKFHYNIPDSNTVTLRGSRNNDSLYIVLKRSTRHFQLAERQFHWISEANR